MRINIADAVQELLDLALYPDYANTPFLNKTAIGVLLHRIAATAICKNKQQLIGTQSVPLKKAIDARRMLALHFHQKDIGGSDLLDSAIIVPVLHFPNYKPM